MIILHYNLCFQIGDQIVRINGLPVEDATHREVLQLIQSQSNLNFKVRCKFNCGNLIQNVFLPRYLSVSVPIFNKGCSRAAALGPMGNIQLGLYLVSGRITKNGGSIPHWNVLNFKMCF